MTFPTLDELVQGAERETGHTDWATEHTGTPFEALRLLADDLQRHAALNPLGEARMFRRVHEGLCARLTYIADRKRHPGWADEKIEAPIFILGLPRAGTTFLHNLLSADPANRGPRLYEMQFPAPKDSHPLGRALREQRCRESLTFCGLMDDDWLAVHPMGAERAEESVFFWEILQISMTYSAVAEVPTYLDYIYKTDFRQLYREERAFLQYLQHGERARRWVLKSPIHVRFLEEIIEVFPDALFVHCHRDTAKIYPSIANMARVLRSKYADLPPGKGAIASDYDGTWKAAYEFRQRPEMKGRFIDVRFLDFQADPLGTVDRIYDGFGLGLDPSRRAAMGQWLEADTRQRAGQRHHQYTLEDIGLTDADVDRISGDYLRAYDVPLER